MKWFMVLLLGVSCAGCSAKAFVVGEVAHQVVTCTDAEVCKDRIAKDCPDGGVLYGITPAVEVEYSCRT